jgi:hypothetical protein
MLIGMACPFLFIVAGPAGIPARAVLSVELVAFLAALFCRIVGMFINLIGENRDFFRVISSWFFLALIYLATIQLAPPLNPIIAVVRQQNEASPLVTTVGPVALDAHPVVPPMLYLLGGTVLALLGLVLGMRRRRAVASDRVQHG